MANRQYRQQFLQSNAGQVVAIFAQVSIGASGAPTLNYGGNLISSITRNSAGDYTILLRDVYARLMAVLPTINSGNSAPAAPAMWVKSNTVSTAGSPSIRVVFNAAGVATDPANGEVIYLSILLNNSSLN